MMAGAMRALLHSGGPLGPDGRAHLAAFYGPARRVGFITAASLGDADAVFERIRATLEPAPPEGAGLSLVHVRWDARPLAALDQVQAVLMGGGNTYALLQRLTRSGLLDAIRARAAAGTPYAGASAGSNVAGPNILTTNDWNVVGHNRFGALGLVPFNINPHYKETDPAMAPFSETRDDRIREYHAVNANPVLGLEEGALVVVEDGRGTIRGTARARLFRRGGEPVWLAAGEALPPDVLR